MKQNLDLINLIVSIPFEKWNKSSTELKGKKIIIGHKEGNFWFEIDGVKFSDAKDKEGYNKTNTYCYALHEFEIQNNLKLEKQKQQEVYDFFFK